MSYFILNITFEDGTTGTTTGYSTDTPDKDTLKSLAQNDIVSHGKIVESVTIEPISLEEYKKIRDGKLPF